MRPHAARAFLAWLCLYGSVLAGTISMQAAAMAQSSATLSGEVTDAKGNPIPHARVSLRTGTASDGKQRDSETDADGNYSFAGLAPGSYTLSAATDNLRSPAIEVNVTDVPHQTLDLLVSPAPAPQPGPSGKPSPELPAAPNPPPTQAPASPSLEDLGFSNQQTQSNAQLQARLEKRTHMLKVHQRLGLITAIPMAAAVITGPMASAKGKNGDVIKEPTDANLDFHAALGGVTTVLYFSTAYYAIRAPRIANNPKHGAIRLHEALAFVHGPGMILTPVLGYMAYRQENSGEKPHGIAAAHGAVAYTTALAYGASIVAISWPIHWKFWEKR